MSLLDRLPGAHRFRGWRRTCLASLTARAARTGMGQGSRGVAEVLVADRVRLLGVPAHTVRGRRPRAARHRAGLRQHDLVAGFLTPNRGFLRPRDVSYPAKLEMVLPAGLASRSLAREGLVAGRLDVLDVVHALAQPCELPVHPPPGAVRVPQGLVLRQAVPRVVAEDVRERDLCVRVEP